MRVVIRVWGLGFRDQGSYTGLRAESLRRREGIFTDGRQVDLIRGLQYGGLIRKYLETTWSLKVLDFRASGLSYMGA